MFSVICGILKKKIWKWSDTVRGRDKWKWGRDKRVTGWKRSKYILWMYGSVIMKLIPLYNQYTLKCLIILLFMKFTLYSLTHWCTCGFVSIPLLFLSGFSLFVTNIHQLPSVKSSFRQFHISLIQLENRILLVTHPMNGSADGIGFKLVIKPFSDFVKLSHIHLGGLVVLESLI